MNKYEKALENIYNDLQENFILHLGKELVLLNELVERATPKKTKCDTPFHDISKCPICDFEIINKPNFCENCGQALDWSDDNE